MKKQLLFLGVATIIGLSGCGNIADRENNESKNKEPKEEETNHSEMNHSSTGEIPEGLKEAANPKYEVGSTATIQSDHMGGMKGAEATISGAFDTTVYAVSYTPITGGDPVKNHKWVIHEEIKDAGDTLLKPGDEADLNADHMKGMKGAKATIDTAEQTTVYMVDFTPTTGGEPVKNHKWVTESELSSAGNHSGH
ncbi:MULTISPECIES: YdhK family protein [Metabacillus]|uniref:YdhK family protein n=1 Tax=Metabacillus hrfriensis TaxID=3048891 RepID=A0ACD4RJ45_9BACI|nr:MULTISPECIES: YdhK family protein [Metabacillus]UAL54706.1 YdhK family protein [Metabacillus dongyingensis]UOK59664.1 YdhK family protein [Bacillus sp. OVS6]USK31005.1 YdhK family protein [Bacillus sp. CMF21]WHZ60235.1 YdhK family protein [Metabacillus sp. CT-WN-B3]